MARRTSRRAELALLVLLPLLSITIAGTGSAQSCSPAIEYGINPSFQTWTSRAIAFSDAFQRARDFFYWGIGPGDVAPVIPLGSGRVGEGWPDPSRLGPGQRYGAPLFGSMEGTLPDGRTQPYVVTWNGRGTVALEGVYVVSESNRTSNRVEVFVDPTLGNGNSMLACTWVTRRSADPVRDIHVWLPGMEPGAANGGGQLFWPPFLEKLRAMNAGHGPETLRMLDWTRINEYGRPLSAGGFRFDAAGLITPASPSQGTLRGVCVEYQVALCNELGANLHFQVPHRTDDLTVSEYRQILRNLLRRIRDGSPGVPGILGGLPFEGLRPDLSVTLELSNEMWNPIFPVFDWMLAQARDKGIPFQEQVASEIQQVFDLARGVFFGPHAGRLRTYVPGCMPNAGHMAGILRRLRPDTRIDALGAAAYLAPRRPDMDAWLVDATPVSCPNCPDADALLVAADDAIDALRVLIGRHASLAESWTNPDGSHPALELYEAGLNLKSENRPWDQAAHEVQVRPEVFDLFAGRFVPMLIDAGVQKVHWYSFMTDQNSDVLDTYGFWNDMQQEITLPVSLPYVHEGAPKAAFLCLGPPPSADCSPASALTRTGSGDVDSYSATAPVLGRRFEASVDLRITGHRSAYVVFSLSPSSIPLPAETSLFSDPSAGVFLELQSGSVPHWSLPVPNDLSLAGLEIATQAVQVGRRTTAFSNIIDLHFGR